MHANRSGRFVALTLASVATLVALIEPARASYLTINQPAIQPNHQNLNQLNHQNHHSSHHHQQQQQQQLLQQQQQQQQQQPPSIIPFSFNQNVQENQRAIVMCTTSSGENPVSFSWLKDGEPLTGALAQARRITIKPDADSSTLKISSVRLDHAGNYTCLAKNRFGSQLHSAQLVVHGEPRWLLEPQHEPLVATRGQTVVIDCRTTGWPKPEQTWKFKTHSQGDFLNVSHGLGGRISVAANGSLIIRQADKLDEANYLCISSNGIGRGLSWSTSLKVTVPAHFETNRLQQRPQMSVVRKQSQVQLRCDAYGDQPITIEWFKDRQPLAATAAGARAFHHAGELLADARHSIHSENNPLRNGLISQLLIRQAQRTDNAVYECVTRNQFGRDRQTMELVVQEEPDYIQELQVTAVSSRSVTLMWSEPYDGRSAITSYMFQYKRVQEAPTTGGPLSAGPPGAIEAPFGANEFNVAADPAAAMLSEQQAATGRLALADADWQHANRLVLPIQGNGSAQTGASERSITIEKLEPSSKYLLRALAVNAIGQSRFSPPMEFSTDEEAPEVGPVNIRALAINSTSIQVSWDEIPRSRHLGRIHGYYIGYRMMAVNNTAATNFIYKPYIINDSSVSAGASSSSSSSSSAAAASPSSSSSSSSVSPASSAAADAAADTAAQASQDAAGASPTPSVVPGAAVPRLETLIQDLRRDTVYEITVVAFNSRGSGPSSDFVVCKTVEMEAPKPVRLTIRRESNESIFVEWQRDPNDQNPVDDYVLYQEKNAATHEWHHVRLPGNQTHYKAAGLKCGTRYQFYVIAHNKVGRSAPSDVVSASTSGAIPMVPGKLALLKWVNSTCLLVNLNSFQDNGCRIRTFTVRYRVERLQQQQQQQQQQQLGDSVGGAQLANGNGVSTVASGAAAAAAAVAAAASAAPGQQQATGAETNSNGAANQLIGSNGMPASHQALTAAAVTGGAGSAAGVGPGAGSQGAKSGLGSQGGPLGGMGGGSAAGALGASEWVAIRPKSNLKQQRANEEDRMEYLCDLSPVGEYTIHVAALNDVGRSEIEYTALMSSDELKHSALRDLADFLSSLSGVFAYIPSLLVFLMAALLLIIVSLILYTTAIKYYQKFVIMQNQMRATRRAKADERRRRKLNGAALSHGARNPSHKSAELWAEEYDEELDAGALQDDCERGPNGAGHDDNDDDDDCREIVSGQRRRRPIRRGRRANANNCASSQDSILDGLARSGGVGDHRDDDDGREEDYDGGVDEPEDEEDATTTTTEELASSSSSGSGRSGARRAARRNLVSRHASSVSMGRRQSELVRQHQQHQLHYHQKQHSNPLLPCGQALKQQQHQRHLVAQQQHQASALYHSGRQLAQQQQQQQQQQSLYGAAGHRYLSNIVNNSAFDTSSIDSRTCAGAKGKPAGAFNGNGSICLSTASNESIHGRFQCLSSKQYVKMNEYTMLPSISASIVAQQQQAANPSEIYGTLPVNHATRHAALYRPLNGSSPSGQSSASNATASAGSSGGASSGSNNNGCAQANLSGANSMPYSTLRRTNMRTYLPQQQQQQQRQQQQQQQQQPQQPPAVAATQPQAQSQQQQQLVRRPSQNVNDIYGYYMAPQAAQAQAQAAAAQAAQQAANEAAHSIFVPPQQIIYSAPNIRRQPPVFL